MEEKQNGLGEDQVQEECKPEAEPSKSSREDSYWCDDYTEILAGLDHIVALADVMTTVIGNAMDTCREQGGSIEIDLNYDTLPSMGHLIQEKAARIKFLVEEELTG